MSAARAAVAASRPATPFSVQRSEPMQQPNASTLVEVTADELPMHCPTPEASLWNSHPRVYIPLEDALVPLDDALETVRARVIALRERVLGPEPDGEETDSGAAEPADRMPPDPR